MKLALVHDWFADVGGAERTLIALHRIWPDAPIYLLVGDPTAVRRWLPNATIRYSPLQRIPFAARWRALLAPCMPSAIEGFDLSSYDTVISSSVLFAKGIVVRPHTRHFCYCYSPARMLWDRSATYERSGILSRIARHLLRSWDFAAAQRPDQFIAISQTVADRITHSYRRPSIVIPPPITLAVATSTPSAAPYYLVVGRLVPHKKLDVLIRAFQKLQHRLVIVGSGPQERALRHIATPNISFAGALDDATLSQHYANCTAVILPNEEDWGLTPLEAFAHGKPVLALRKGGATEYMVEGVTGELFDDTIPEAIADGLKRLRSHMHQYAPDHLRSIAAGYSSDIFARRIRTFVEQPL